MRYRPKPGTRGGTMIDIGALDTVIAIVVVLLVLSLLVQSIQSLLKKLLKLKSAVVMGSLLDLFQYVGTQELIGHKPAEFVELVKTEFKQFDPATVQTEVSRWFDAVMQSFDERYTRHMKTVAIITSIVVVIVLNANIFAIYRNIALNDALRAVIVSSAQEIQKQGKSGPDQSNAEVKSNVQQVQQFINDYKGVGFNPIRPRQVKDFISGQGAWQGVPASDRFAHGLKVMLGWGIMVLLLSVGAPFWEDTLESLFGVKNLLRKKSDTANVEDRGGQQKP